jgi:hypothetical protein
MGDNHLSEVYSFVVDSSFLGDIDGTIEVAIPHTVLLKHTIEGEDYEAKVNLPNYHSPDLNKSYFLFLKKAQTKDVFGPSSVPFQAEVNSSGKVSLVLNTENEQVTLTTKNNDKLQFLTERVDLSSIDQVSGLTKDIIIEKIKSAVNSMK